MGGEVARGGIWALSGQAVLLAATLIATPFVIRQLGPSQYGLWALLQITLLYLTLGDFGMAIASTKFGSDRHAHEDARGEATVIFTALAITVTLTGLVALAVSAAAPLIVDNVLHIPGPLRDDAEIGLRLVCIAAIAFGVAGTISTPQQVRLRWGSVTLATSGPRVLQVACAPLVLVVAGGGVVTLAVLAAVSATLAVVLNAAAAVRYLPQLRRPNLSRSVARLLVRYGGALTVAGLAAIPLSTGERFFLAHYHSTTEVAYYAVAATLGALLLTIPQSASQVLFPALARLESSDRIDDHRRLYHQTLKSIFLLTVPAALGLVFVARPFLDLWAGPAYAVHSTVPLDIIAGCLCINTLSYLPYTHLLAAGRVSTVAKVHVAELVPYLLVAAVLTREFGATGAAAAWGGRLVVSSVVFFAIARKTDGLRWVPTPERALLSIVTLACLGVAFLLSSTTTTSLAGRGIWTVFIFAAYAAIAWRLVLTAGERQGLSALGRELRHRRGGGVGMV
jgi:O-antigen/teichoic acid export membrane protein